MGDRGPKRTYRPNIHPRRFTAPTSPGSSPRSSPKRCLTVYDTDDPRPLLREWTVAAERLMRATNATVTFGLQAKPLPPFDGDALDPRRCGGDLAVLIQAQDEPPQRLEGPEPRWERRGTRHARGALGFQEGTINLRRPMDFDRHVWVRSNDRTGMIGGTYLVVRDIHVNDTWHDLTAPEQERVIGRSNAPAPRSPASACTTSPSSRPSPPTRTSASPRREPPASRCSGAGTTPMRDCCSAFMADARRQFTRRRARLAIPPGATPGRSSRNHSSNLSYVSLQSPISPIPAAPGPGRPLLPSPR